MSLGARGIKCLVYHKLDHKLVYTTRESEFLKGCKPSSESVQTPGKAVVLAGAVVQLLVRFLVGFLGDRTRHNSGLAIWKTSFSLYMCTVWILLSIV